MDHDPTDIITLRGLEALDTARVCNVPLTVFHGLAEDGAPLREEVPIVEAEATLYDLARMTPQSASAAVLHGSPWTGVTLSIPRGVWLEALEKRGVTTRPEAREELLAQAVKTTDRKEMLEIQSRLGIATNPLHLLDQMAGEGTRAWALRLKELAWVMPKGVSRDFLESFELVPRVGEALFADALEQVGFADKRIQEEADLVRDRIAAEN